MKLSLAGVGRSFLRPRFLIVFVLSYLIFGTILNLLAGGTGGLDLARRSGAAGAAEILLSSLFSFLTIGRAFSDWLIIFIVTLLQSVLIGLLAVVLKHRKDSANLQNAGIAAGLAILGSGCPTCGTTLLMPVVMSVFGSGSLAVAGTISWLLTAASVLIAALAVKKLGFEVYAIYEDEDYRKRKE